MMRACAGCLHWEPARAGPLGECRRYAPTAASPVWPETDQSDWCGDFEPAIPDDDVALPN